MKYCPFYTCLLAIILLLGLPSAAFTQAQQEKGLHRTTTSTHRSDSAGRSSSEGTETIDDLGEKLNNGIDSLGKRVSSYVDARISSYLGDWVNNEVSYGITWFTILVCAVLLASVLVVERLLRALNRRIVRRIRTEDEAVSLLELLFAALAQPLSLVIWIYGIYAALTPLLQFFKRPDGSNLVQDITHRVINVAVTIVPFWFIYLFIGLLDDALSKRAAATAERSDRILSTLMRSWRRPLRILFLVIWVRIAVPLFGGPAIVLVFLNYIFALALIACIAWLVIRTTDILEDVVLSHYRIDVQDNLEARKIHTQIRFLKRVIVITVSVVAVASMLMMFQKVRQFGASILASAGVLGIVAGLAAQRSIANLLVGIQVAITQPIRVDDVVIVENEWGQIEEITSTYVVVRIWDLRRLILPLTYFTEKPFQNWTRTSADLLGTVFLYVDYSIPVEEVRQELYRILRESKLWDGKVWALQVTDAKERTIELRALVSAANASTAWNLRCEVRERLITYVQQNYPASLPKLHVALNPPGKESPGCFSTEEKDKDNL